MNVSFKWFLFFVSISIAALTLMVIPKAQENKIAAPVQNYILRTRQERLALPVRIKIPSISVDTDVGHVGLNPDGAMDTPKDPETTAWFDLGPRPGEVGSAVISGHFGWKNNIPAVFDNLNKLKKGDKVYVENEKGQTIAFIVRDSKKYDSNAYASEVFNSNDGKTHLNLITCEGAWNKKLKSYSDRLVVFADKEI